jgi:hypothetical protein
MSGGIFLNKNEMVSFYWVDVEIGRGDKDFLYTLSLACHRDSLILILRIATVTTASNTFTNSLDADSTVFPGSSL